MKDIAASLSLPLVMISMVLTGGCGGGGPVAPAAALLPEIVYPQAVSKKEISSGSGIISPYKILDKKSPDGNLLVINGGGETGGAGYLYQVDAETFEENNTRISVGMNPSDIIWVGDRIVISCRGNDKLYLVDVNEWRVIDSANTVASPTSLAALPGNRFVVTGAISYVMEMYDVTYGGFKKTVSASSSESVFHIVADKTGAFLYGNIPSNGSVRKFNATTLTAVSEYYVGGSPSYGSVVINNHLYVTDRDGYIRDVNLQTGAIKSLDLAIPLSLNRKDLPVRGIDPMDLIKMDDHKMLVVNNRQKSVILTIAGDGELQTATSFPLLSGGTYGEYIAASNRAYITKTPRDSVVKYENLAAESVPSETIITTGRRIRSSVLLNHDGEQYMAIMSSNGALRITNLSTGAENTVEPPTGFSWHSEVKLSAWNGDRFAVLAIDGAHSIFEAIVFDALGTELFNKTLLNRNSVFSIKFTGDEIIVVSRMFNKVEVVRVENGASTEYVLGHQRPREAVAFENGDWAVVHDTNPDIGYTYYHNNRATYFPLDINGWPSDVLALNEKSIIISSFTTGRLLCLAPDSNRLIWETFLPFSKVDRLVPNSSGSFWAVSQSSGAVAKVDISNQRIMQSINVPSAIDVLPDYSNDGFWIVTEDKFIQYAYDR